MILILFPFVFVTAQSKDDNVIIGKYDKLHSKILNEERTLLISLPQGYEHSQEKYPAIYVLDGSATKLAEIFSTVNFLSWVSIPRMIIVTIQNTNRNRDMLQEAHKFLQFITEELSPYIEKKYRANNGRILYGESNAGVFVVSSLLENPDSFSAYIASSPTIIWRYDYMIDKVKEVSANQSEMNKRLYIIYGDNEWTKVRDTLHVYIPMLEKLKSKGLKIKTKFVSDGKHVPLNSLYYGLKSIFEEYRYPDEKRRQEGLDSLKSYYERFSNKIGYKVKYPLGAINGLGQRLLFQDSTEAAINVFEVLRQDFPEDKYVDIMLAIAYYKNNNMEQAKQYYLRAKKNKELETPPFAEWEEMRKKFK